MHEAVVLPVGERMGQLVFMTTGPVDGSYAEGRKGMSGKYQNSDDLDNLIANWRPSDMLPRAYKDARTLPRKINGLRKGVQ
mgnify:CR=1 FL=1